MGSNIAHPPAEGLAVDPNLTQSIHDVPELALLEVLASSGPLVDELCQVGGIVIVLDLGMVGITYRTSPVPQMDFSATLQSLGTMMC